MSQVWPGVLATLSPDAMTLRQLLIQPYDHDDDLIAATRRDGQPRVRVYRPRMTQVVLGRSSRPEAELNTEACLADRVPVFGRRGGGCAVVLDRGNVIISVAIASQVLGAVRRHFARLSDWLIDGLVCAGVEPVHREGVSDLVVGDRKIGGGCIYGPRGLLFYSASLLFAPDLSRVERYLKHPPREPDYRRGRTHADFMGSLADRVGDMSIGAFSHKLRSELRPPSL
jgi:lipoate-protein ligase A